MNAFVCSNGEEDRGKDSRLEVRPGESLIRGCAVIHKVRNVSRNPVSDLASGGKPAN